MMTEQEVVTLMRSSMTEAEWNSNCDRVKSECKGYPSFWYGAVVLSGVAREVTARWGGDDKIRIGREAL